MKLRKSWFKEEICKFYDEVSGISYCGNKHSCPYKGKKKEVPGLDFKENTCEIDGISPEKGLVKLTEV